jgi:hypothetical protein
MQHRSIMLPLCARSLAAVATATAAVLWLPSPQPVHGSDLCSAPRLPEAAPPIENAALLYYRAALLTNTTATTKVAELFDPQPGWNPPEELEKLLAEQESTIQTFLRASMIDRCTWGIETDLGIGALLPELGTMRGLARVVAADAWIHIARGGQVNAVIAAERIAALLRASRHIAMDGMLINAMVGAAMAHMADRALDELLSRGPLPEEARRVLVEALDRLDPSDPFNLRGALVNERLLAFNTLGPIVAGRKTDPSLEELIRMAGVSNSPLARRLRAADRVLLLAELRRLERYYDDLLKAWDAPDRLARMKELDAAVEKNEHGLFASILAPALTKAAENNDAVVQRLRDARRKIMDRAAPPAGPQP